MDWELCLLSLFVSDCRCAGEVDWSCDRKKEIARCSVMERVPCRCGLAHRNSES